MYHNLVHQVQQQTSNFTTFWCDVQSTG